MRRTFSNRRNALVSPTGFSAGLVVLVALVGILLVRLFIPGFFLTALAPAFSVSTFLAEKTHAALSGFSDAVRLTAYAEKLAAENAVLAAENRALTDQVASLAALLGDSGAQTTGSGVVAGVLARPPVSPYGSLVLGKGSNAGIDVGYEVFGPGGVPVGIISTAAPGFSRATLFSAPGETLAAWIGDAHLPVTLAGAGAGAFDARVPRSAAVAVGDAVYAPGPGARPIGILARIDGEAAAPSIALRIAPSVNPATLTEVVVRDTGAALLGSFSCATATPDRLRTK